MSSYKLKKWYPSLPESWKNTNIILNIWNNKVCDSSLITIFKVEEIENNPEFWEKVVEPDYEILSFKQNSLIPDLWTKFGNVWGRNNKGKCSTLPYTTEDILKSDYFFIYSVKRLSDGEI